MDIPALKEAKELYAFMVTLAGGLSAWSAHRYTVRKRHKTEIDDIRSETAELREKIHQLEMGEMQIRTAFSMLMNVTVEQVKPADVMRIIRKQIKEINHLREFIYGFPACIWMKRRNKDGAFIMLQVSRMYASTFLGGDASVYIGRQDKDIWPPEVADAFRKNDEEAIASGKFVQIKERVVLTERHIDGWFAGYKWSVRSDNGDIDVYGYGIYTPL